MIGLAVARRFAFRSATAGATFTAAPGRATFTAATAVTTVPSDAARAPGTSLARHPRAPAGSAVAIAAAAAGPSTILAASHNAQHSCQNGGQRNDRSVHDEPLSQATHITVESPFVVLTVTL
jgi:hypothetical protein